MNKTYVYGVESFKIYSGLELMSMKVELPLPMPPKAMLMGYVVIPADTIRMFRYDLSFKVSGSIPEVSLCENA